MWLLHHGAWALGTLAVVTVVMVTISQLTRRQPSTAQHSQSQCVGSTVELETKVKRRFAKIG